MAKRSNKTRPDGRIAVQVYLGIVDGKRKYKTVYGATQKEADAKAQDIKVRMGLGINILTENTPFKDYRELWLSNKKHSVGDSYYNVCVGYSNTLSVFDNYEVRNLKEHHIQTLINNLAIKNPHTGKPTAKKTLASITSAVFHILQIAVKQGAIAKNPAEDIIIPGKAPETKRKALTDEQIKWIEETPHRAQTAAMIMLYSGIRRGELLALTWNDINLIEKTITINKAVEMIKGKSQIKHRTKTDAGMRVVYIPQKLVDYISGIDDKESILVVPNTEGNLMSEGGWRKMWSSYILDLNIKYGVRTKTISKFAPRHKNPMIIQRFTGHQLRHTFATMLYMAGVDLLTAKEQLGHADINTTLSIYTHLDAIYKKKNIAKLDDYLSDKSKVQVICKSESL